MKLLRSSLLLLIALAVVGAHVVVDQEATAQADRLDKLTLAGPPGPLSIPLVYLVTQNKLADIADEVELVMWQDQNQLRALIAGQQADFVTMPSNNAAIFYNNGFDLQLLDISVWNSSFAVSTDPSVTTLADAAGLRVVIPFQGSVPDLVFQYLATRNDLDPNTDFTVQYSTNPTQAAQMIIAGQVDIAILPEPLVTAVLLQTKDSEAPLQRVFSIGNEWDAVTDDTTRTAIAGTVALPTVQSDVIDVFMREYALAVEWTIAHPAEAGIMAEEELPELGFASKAVELSLQNVEWKYVPAAEGYADINQFFALMMELSPDVVGGQLPDDAFYYAAPVAE